LGGRGFPWQAEAGNGAMSLTQTAAQSKASPASRVSHHQSPPEGSGPVPTEEEKPPPSPSLRWIRLAGPAGVVWTLGLHLGDPGQRGQEKTQ